jgi:inosose dehydratase
VTTTDDSTVQSTQPRLAATPITWGYVGGGRWGVDLPRERILAEMVEIGFQTTEVGVPGFLPEDATEAKAILDDFGLGTCSGPVSFVVHEQTGRDEALDKVRSAAARLAALGGSALVTVPKRGNVGTDETLSADGWDRLIEGLSEVGRIAAEHGLSQALHPHVGSLIETAEDMMTLAERSDVGWCLDTAHVASGGLAPDEFAAAVNGRINLVHVKDLDVDMGTRMVAHTVPFDEAITGGVFVPLGAGDLDIAAALAPLPRDVWWVLEQDIALPEIPAKGEGPMVAAAASLATFLALPG